MTFLGDHWQLITCIGAPVVMAAVSALPEPTPGGNKFYAWFYAFSHAVKFNYPQAAQGAKMALK